MIAGKPQLQAGLLTVVAGLADAVGYVAMGGMFAASMTGNTRVGGPFAGRRPLRFGSQAARPLVTFFLGAMLARLLLRLFHRPGGLLVLAVTVGGMRPARS
jgi:uncharacterized membrane protein YoaK (UPF0700 family)